MEKNIPVVRPEWVTACEREGRIVGVRLFYLNVDPKMRPPMSDISPNPSQFTQPGGQSARTDDGRHRREELTLQSPPHQTAQQQQQQQQPIQQQQPQLAPFVAVTPPPVEAPKQDTSKAHPPLPETNTPEPESKQTTPETKDERPETPPESERLGSSGGGLGVNKEAALIGEGFESVAL